MTDTNLICIGVIVVVFWLLEIGPRATARAAVELWKTLRRKK